MNKSSNEATTFIEEVKNQNLSNAEIWLAVPYIALAESLKTASNSPIKIGVQNVSQFNNGAYTGEISADMVAKEGAFFTLLGHSERRHIFHENHESIALRVEQALSNHLNIVFCMGETKEDFEKNQTEEILRVQVRESLKNVPAEKVESITIAYEPVWAIGTNLPASPDIVEKILKICKTSLSVYWSLPTDKIKVLYGGSVNATNARSYLELEVVDGLLVGGASLNVKSFMDIVHQAEGL